MTLAEVLHAAQRLSTMAKLKLIQVLAAEDLDRSEDVTPPLPTVTLGLVQS